MQRKSKKKKVQFIFTPPYGDPVPLDKYVKSLEKCAGRILTSGRYGNDQKLAQDMVVAWIGRLAENTKAIVT